MKGATSLISNTLSGAFNSVSKITGAIGSGFATLCFDDKYNEGFFYFDLYTLNSTWRNEKKCVTTSPSMLSKALARAWNLSQRGYLMAYQGFFYFLKTVYFYNPSRELKTKE